ncbi:EAL and HDOD domain-containing protein [Chitinibacteraceae bacterium HSL-7]
MFDHWFRKLTGKDDTPAPVQSQPSPSQAQEPVNESPEQASGWARGLLRRRPVLDARYGVRAYELHLKPSVNRVAPVARGARLADQILLREVAERGYVRHHPVVLVLSGHSATLPELEQVEPPRLYTLLFRDDAEWAGDMDAAKALFGALKQRGFRVGLAPQRFGEATLQILEFSDVVRIDFAELSPDELRDHTSSCALRAPECVRLGVSIDTAEAHGVALALGLDWLSGLFQSWRDGQEAGELEAEYLQLVEVLNLVQGGAEFGVIAAKLKLDPLLTFKLLRYVNSPAVGLARSVDSIEQALTILGHQPLYRWLSLLMFSQREADPIQEPLLEAALARARFLENIAAKRFDERERQQLFTVGVFSYLDALLRRPMAKLLQRIELPAPMRDALLERAGPYGPWLSLAVAFDEGEHGPSREQIAELGVGLAELNLAWLEAQLWADSLLSND